MKEVEEAVKGVLPPEPKRSTWALSVVQEVDPALAALCDDCEIERYNSEAFSTLSIAFTQAIATLARSS